MAKRFERLGLVALKSTVKSHRFCIKIDVTSINNKLTSF